MYRGVINITSIELLSRYKQNTGKKNLNKKY